MKRKKIIWSTLIIIAIIVVAVVLYSMQRNNTQEVTVSSAEEGLIVETIYANGKLEPIERKNYFATLSGKVEEILVSKGDTIEVGQVLLRMNIDEYEEQIKLEMVNQEIIVAQRKQVEEEYKQRFKEQKRIDPEMYIAPLDVAQYDLQVKRSQLLIDSYNKQIAQRDVVATAAGLVSELHVQQGEYIVQGSPLLLVEDVSSYQVKAYISEMEANKVSEGMEVSVLGDSFSQIYDGQIQHISVIATMQGSSTDASVEMLITLDGELLGLRSGYNATVEISLDDEPRLLVPIEAVFYQQDQAYIYRVIEGIANQVAVTTGKENDTHIEITTGIQEGDVIVIEGMTSLKNGIKVTVK